MATLQGPDQAYSWIIAAASFVINGSLSGLSRATGVFYLALIENFGITRKEAYFVVTLRLLVRSLSGPFVGILGQHFGVRAVTATGGIFTVSGIVLCTFTSDIKWITTFWGLLFGFGYSLANTLFPITINQYFVKCRATAIGIAYSGACLGAFVFPVIMETFLNLYGLNGTFLLTAGLMMHILPASIFLKEPPWVRHQENKDSSLIRRENPAEKDNEKKSTESHEEAPNQEIQSVPWIVEQRQQSNEGLCYHKRNAVPLKRSIWASLLSVYRNLMFYMISISLLAVVFLFDPFITIILDYIKDKGIDHSVGKYLIITLSIGDLAGRLCFGWITDKKFLSESRFMMLNQVLQGLCFLSIPFLNSLAMLVIILLAYGASFGATLVMFPVLITKYLPNDQSIATGCYGFLSGLGYLVIPFIVGHFRDNNGSYDALFYMSGTFSIAIGLVWLSEPWLLHFCKAAAPNSSRIQANE